MEEKNGDFLITSRAHIFERLTAILDFLIAQPSKPNLKQVKARFSFVPKLYEDYEKLEAQILLYNSQPKREEKLTYKKERKALDDVVTRIHEVYEDITEREQRITTEIAPNRLPKLQLPRFSGNFKEWQSFKEIYEAMVHSAPLPQIEKFQRLKGCLQGEPLQLIEHFPLSGENYPIVYQALINRYDNPRIAANSYLYALLNFKSGQGDSHAALQSFLVNHFDTIKAYKALDIGDHYDYLLFQICYGHLDKRTQRAFDEKYPVDRFPTYDNLMQFIQDRLRTLELHTVENEKGSRGPIRHTFNVFESHNEFDQNKLPCYACSKNHPLINCSKFLCMSLSQRYELLKKNYLCFNCFRKHQRHMCNSPKRCKRCGRAHHTLLHSGEEEKGKSISESHDSHKITFIDKKLNDNKTPPTKVTCLGTNPVYVRKSILLGTAQGYISGSVGKSTMPVRILLDPGSQVSCVTEEIIDKLNIKMEPENTQIKGISDIAVKAKGRADCVIFTTPKRTKGFNFNLLVLPAISASLPELQVHESVKNKFKIYKLADPNFDQAGPVDVLIGADYFYDIVTDKRVIKGKPNGVPTAFGIALIGEIPTVQEIPELKSFSITLDSLEQALLKFWETEELKSIPPLQDEWCETFFKKTVERTSSGRYIVALPFNCDQPDAKIGDNRKNALRRLSAMERRFKGNLELYNSYKAFLDEYHDLGHMSVAKSPAPYVIPHHAVFKESTTTKLRVVFDASNVGDNGVSLNQLLRKGPKLQKDIFITITGFRKFKVALVSDIKMMYRQILIRPQDRKYQRIFWRNSIEENPTEFELNTVTYGLACSSYLAQRVVQQLVEDEGKNFPLAADTLMNQIYVDDIVSGGESVEETLRLYAELVELLGRGGFFPRKWSSSSPSVLEHIPSEHKETPLKIQNEDNVMYKVLGVKWDPNIDAFTYQIEEFKETPTKRAILSYIARMFDPLGWLTPFVFNCKHFMQRLWLEGLSWDDILPSPLQVQWSNIVGEVQCLTKIRIPRYIPIAVATKLQLIGFCDASEKGFAAVLYLRCVVGNKVTVCLLGAKSKVAPVRPVTIPRLELNAAHLLSKLFKSFKPVLERFPTLSVSLFSDSQVVLGWLKTPPHKLKTYVCNRVAEILNITSPNCWAHVSSEQNAADCASRGLEPQIMINHPLWWNGPEFLHKLNWEHPVVDCELPAQSALPELKQVLVTTIDANSEKMIPNISKFSSLTKLSRVFAYILRFAANSRHKASHFGPLKLCEIKNAVKKCIWVTQKHYFNKEIALIKAGAPVHTLKMLSPFLDQEDLVRVGGRLENAPIPYDAKHPLLIPYSSHLARLIVNFYHKVTLHGGPQITRSAVQRQYWVPKVGNLIKSVIFNCTTCRRQNAKPATPLMGALPPSRFDQVRPFLRVGTDFCGPFSLRETPRKKTPSFKAYVCLFICFSTKAVHLEIVTTLSTESFLAALDRFVARRGLCAFLYSDNGTNFTGAARKLTEVRDFLNRNANSIEEQCANREIQWVFNPPAAPHFGGLWEAAVKSFKFHLTRVMGSHAFTIEEFATLTCRIESILNSRPLYPLASFPSDSEIFLTPGHFLIGAPLQAVPELPLTDLKINTLSRWQLIAQCVQHFWKTWSRTYLQSLLPRKKWQVNQDPPGVGDVVIIRNEKTNPLCWPLGRVEELFKGRDGICRVAKIRCNNRTLIRPVHILCKLFEDVNAAELN